MSDIFIHETARVIRSKLGNVKVFRNAVVTDSVLEDMSSIGDDTVIERSVLRAHVAINRRSYINDSIIDSYSYSGINTTINWAKIGRFCSLGRNVDIGGFDHDYRNITTMTPARFRQLSEATAKACHTEQHDHCIVGNDVWIAAGAQVLHKVNIGDGAVIGAGAVVTHDVPPYAIVAGVPARIIGYRCDAKLISELLEIQWWNWSNEKLLRYGDDLLQNEITTESVKKLRSVSSH